MKLDSSIVFAAIGGLIARDGAGFAISDNLNAVGVEPFADQKIGDGARPSFRQPLIVALSTLAVGVTLNDNSELGIPSEHICHSFEVLFCLGSEGMLVWAEQSDIRKPDYEFRSIDWLGGCYRIELGLEVAECISWGNRGAFRGDRMWWFGNFRTSREKGR